MAANKPGGTLNIPIADHRMISTMDDVANAVRLLSAELADQANSVANIKGGFVSESDVEPNPDLTIGTDSARGHVWAKTRQAIRAERKNAILMALAGSGGAV
jgi:hypothetical protein